MPPSHTRVVAEIKLRETERQRDRLRKQYDEVEASAAAATTPLDRLRALHAGLSGITFARRPLHPTVREIDALYLADGLGVVPPELVAERTRFLEHELAQGRLRAEFTYAFGRVLSEWVSSGKTDGAEAAPEADAVALLLGDPAPVDLDWFARLADDNREVLEPVAAKLREFARDEALQPVTAGEVQTALAQIERHPYLNRHLRREAATASASGTQVTELAGVATILLNSLDEWDWPADGVGARSIWVRVKHRPYLDEDLVTAVFLHVVGSRWADAFHSELRWDALVDADGGPVVEPEPPDSPTAIIASDRKQAQAERFLGAARAESPGGGYAGAQLIDLLATVEREVRFARAAFPDRPCYVVQGDLRDFYPALSHEAITEVLRLLGVPARWLRFFGKFLAARVRRPDGVTQLRRGVALEHALSDLFADVVLWTMDLHLFRTTGDVPVRLVDDLWLFADSHDAARDGWAAVEEFCRAAGLAVNAEKSGAVCVGNEVAPLDGLPAGRPRWGLLRLQPSGNWDIDEEAFQRIEGYARAEVKASGSVLELVAGYNGYVGYMTRQLALSLPLGGDHLGRAARRLERMHDELLGPGHGVPAEVGRRLRDCFADARLKEQGLPPALLYWPVTAGGLALAHPLMHVAAHLRGKGNWAPPPPPDREAVAAHLWWREADARTSPLTSGEVALLARYRPGSPHPFLPRERMDQYRRAVADGDDTLPDAEEIETAMAGVWAVFYRECVTVIEPTGPPHLDAMERLVQDFIARGGEVSGRGQSNLAPYWRWVVYAYGPALLDALGTFRFLLTELVPLQLILENRGLVTVPSEDNRPPRAPRGRTPPPSGPNWPTNPDEIPF